MNLYDDHEKKEENKDDPENNDLMEEMWQSMTEQKESEKLSTNNNIRHSEPIAQEVRKFSRLCAVQDDGEFPRTEGQHH